MKKTLCLLLAVIMLIATSGTMALASEPEKTTIEIVIPKPEIREQIQKTVERYNTEVLAGTPYTLQFEAVSDGYDDYLRTRFASGNMVDAFYREPYSQTLYWLEYAEPLTDQAWVDDLDEIAKDGYVWNGELVGMPLGYEGIGVWYHKDLLEQMGRDKFPETYDELVAYAEELVAAGIQPTRFAVNKFINMVNVFQTCFYFNDKPADETILGVASGELKLSELPGFKNFVNWVDFGVKYGARDPEDAVGIDEEVKTKFTTKQIAFLAEGVWQEPNFATAVDTETLGFTALPYSNVAEENKMPVGVPMACIIYKDSPVKEEVKKFLQWFHDQGVSELVDSWKINPCWKSMAADAKLNISNTVAHDYVVNDMADPWIKYYFPEEAGPDILAAVQAYILGECSAEEMADQIQETLASTLQDFSGKG